MRAYKQTVEFANFICHFGDYELLHYLEEIVIPAFTSGARTRMYGDSRYILHGVKLTNLRADRTDEGEPAIVGRFVLDTTLRRDQILVDGKIVPSPDSLRSSPSSLFVLLLRNHKLLFAKQVAGAPGIGAFRTTVEVLLKWERVAYINALYAAAQAAESQVGPSVRVTKKMLAESIPAPRVEIVHLTGSDSIQAFVKQFTILKEVRIKVVKPNAELNNEKLFSEVQQARQDLGAESTSLTHRNASGLHKDAALKHIVPAVDGNAFVNLSGIGQDDEKLSGNNEDFKVVEYVNLPADTLGGATTLFKAYKKMLGSKIISIAKAIVSADAEEKIKRIVNGQ